MPLRSDPSLWWNLPGVVAAYQPVRAPDALLARYNMTHGGDNRYRAEPGVLPTWSPTQGLIFNGSTQWLTTGITPVNDQTWSLLVRFSNGALDGWRGVMMVYNTGPPYQGFGIANQWVNTPAIALYFSGGAGSSNATTSGVLGVAGRRGYKDGLDIGVDIGSVAGGLSKVKMGCSGTIYDGQVNFNPCRIQSALVANRVMSAADMWQASRQMAYCDVNPDWSVWSPRRKWYPYVLQAPAGRAGIYGARPTVALPGGVRIVPQSEGGTNG